MPTVAWRAYGSIVSLTAPAAVIDAARTRLVPAYRPVSAAVERAWEVRRRQGQWQWRVDAEDWSKAADEMLTIDLMLSDLELWVAEHARRNVFVHAGCVAVDGAAIVIPGRSMSGKTSLTAALLRAGADYYSDEYAVLDANGMVRPYARQLSVRRPDGSGSDRRTATELGGGRVGRGPVAIGVVAVLRYEPARGWAAPRVSRGQSLLGLLDNTVAARSRPRAVLSALSAATAAATTIAGTRGDADHAATELLRLLDPRAAEPGRTE